MGQATAHSPSETESAEACDQPSARGGVGEAERASSCNARFETFARRTAVADFDGTDRGRADHGDVDGDVRDGGLDGADEPVVLERNRIAGLVGGHAAGRLVDELREGTGGLCRTEDVRAPLRATGRERTGELTTDLVAQEFLVSRLGHLSRRLEELHQAEVSRFSEERRETWILVFALSIVLIFCFAAFFMNQMEVRDLRTGFEDELERRSLQTVSSIEEVLDDLHLDRVQKMQTALEGLVRDKDRRDTRSLDAVLAELKDIGARGRRDDGELTSRLRAVETQLDALLTITRELHEARKAPGPIEALEPPFVVRRPASND